MSNWLQVLSFSYIDDYFCIEIFLFLLLHKQNILQIDHFYTFNVVRLIFFLQIGLNMDRWLSAIERAVSSVQGTHFNKQKSFYFLRSANSSFYPICSLINIIQIRISKMYQTVSTSDKKKFTSYFIRHFEKSKKISSAILFFFQFSFSN